MSIPVKCAGCGETFQAQRTTAKWCSDRCRCRVARAAAKIKAAEATTAGEATEQSAVDKHDLVVLVRRELVRAEKLDTFAGQLALQLARRMANPDESGTTSSLSKELRAVMAQALEDQVPFPEEKATDPGDDDEVTRARTAREKARKAAGL